MVYTSCFTFFSNPTIVIVGTLQVRLIFLVADKDYIKNFADLRSIASTLEESKLYSLEIEVDNGGGNAWEYLYLVKKLKARRSDKVLKHGLSILNDSRARSKLSAQEWTLYEQVVIAAMDCQRVDIAKDCICVLSKQFPGSTRVGKLEGMLLEANGAWAEADRA